MEPLSILPRREEKRQIDPALAVSLLRDIALIHAKQIKVVAVHDVKRAEPIGSGRRSARR